MAIFGNSAYKKQSDLLGNIGLQQNSQRNQLLGQVSQQKQSYMPGANTANSMSNLFSNSIFGALNPTPKIKTTQMVPGQLSAGNQSLMDTIRKGWLSKELAGDITNQLMGNLNIANKYTPQELYSLVVPRTGWGSAGATAGYDELEQTLRGMVPQEVEVDNPYFSLMGGSADGSTPASPLGSMIDSMLSRPKFDPAAFQSILSKFSPDTYAASDPMSTRMLNTPDPAKVESDVTNAYNTLLSNEYRGNEARRVANTNTDLVRRGIVNPNTGRNRLFESDLADIQAKSVLAGQDAGRAARQEYNDAVSSAEALRSNRLSEQLNALMQSMGLSQADTDAGTNLLMQLMGNASSERNALAGLSDLMPLLSQYDPMGYLNASANYAGMYDQSKSSDIGTLLQLASLFA